MSLINFLLAAFFILLFILLILLFISKRVNKKSDNKNKNKNILDIKLISLPNEIESLSDDSIQEEAKNIYNVYRVLDYKNDENEYEKNTWHSWQVSFLIAMYKRDLELYIPDSKDVFHKDIFCENLETLRASMKKYLKKYQVEVDVDNTKELLTKDLIWNAQEVATMMCFLYKYKNSNNSKDKS